MIKVNTTVSARKTAAKTAKAATATGPKAVTERPGTQRYRVNEARPIAGKLRAIDDEIDLLPVEAKYMQMLGALTLVDATPVVVIDSGD
ncbi:hypothetical protein [Tropicimonas sp. IMCC34043]|uniref:hypothetical protein n=1 Tax=Tropicimonas sp. IMCC34043 TaxID=2248760 RepID=UPI000E28A421|nr:hypothetical protein [Tropicimonas sp. IMCC34043]